MARKVIGILTGNKEVKLSLFISGMIQYIENSKKSTKRQTKKWQNLLELTYKFKKVIKFKTNVHKWIVFVYTISKTIWNKHKTTFQWMTSKNKIFKNKFRIIKARLINWATKLVGGNDWTNVLYHQQYTKVSVA